jgi:hypothetical protein
MLNQLALSSRLQDAFSEIQGPVILVVDGEERTRYALQKFGVNVSKWESGIQSLLAYEGAKASEAARRPRIQFTQLTVVSSRIAPIIGQMIPRIMMESSPICLSGDHAHARLVANVITENHLILHETINAQGPLTDLSRRPQQHHMHQCTLLTRSRCTSRYQAIANPAGSTKSLAVWGCAKASKEAVPETNASMFISEPLCVFM